MSAFALPAPCLACGAPMKAVEPQALHESGSLACEYCGKSEAARQRHLRLRLLQLRRTRDELEAPLKSFQLLKQSWAFALLFLAPLGGWQAWQAMGRADAPLSSAVYAAGSASALFAVVAGYVGMVRAFRRLVRPLQRARPPLQQGLAARCRSCGAELPPVRGAHADCAHCGASNFLDAALATQASALLAAERAEYQRRAQGGKPPDPAAYLKPSRAFYRWGAAGAAGAFVAALALLLLRRG